MYHKYSLLLMWGGREERYDWKLYDDHYSVRHLVPSTVLGPTCFRVNGHMNKESED